MPIESIRSFYTRHLLIFFSFVFLAFYCVASPPVVKYLDIEKGLSNNSVRCIFKDHNGYMWFGTYDGLNRYDGYEFKVFRNTLNDSTSLPHNYINTIGQDNEHNLWVGTGQGLSSYNNLTGNFTPGYYFPFGKKNKERIRFNITAIKTDAKGNLIAGTSGGGVLVKLKGTDVAFQIPCVSYKDGLCGNEIQSITIDSKQRIWIFARDVGLGILNIATKQISLVNNQLKFINCMQADSGNQIWMGSFNGLHQYDVTTNTIVRSFNQQKGKLSSTVVVSLAVDHLKNIWIGTEGGGTNILNPGNYSLNYILSGSGKNTLSSESIFAIFEDEEHRKWLGTYKGGINIIDPVVKNFQTIEQDPLTPNSLANNVVSALYEDRNQNLLIGTDGGGISYWNRSQNKFTNYKSTPGNPTTLSHNSVPGFQQDYLGNIWVATYGDGINKFDAKTGVFKHYTCINNLTGEENNLVWLLYEDKEHNLWATTYGNGKLYLFNRQADRFEIFSQVVVDFFSLKEDNSGTLWGGTAYGLVKVDKQNHSYRSIDMVKPIRSIYEDKKGNFWLGTEGAGLVLYDRAKNKILASFTTGEGLCNNSVLNILEDDKGLLWLSTFNGLSRFNPLDKTFKNYYQEDGLQSNQFIYNAAYRLQSGEMVFGGIKGFNIFNPHNIEARNYNSALTITGLRINNSGVNFSSSYITEFADDKIKSLKIPFKEAVLSVDFAALEYSAPGKIMYAYYLEGWDKGWNYSGKLRSANYTKLSEGNYVLHIKATNAGGSWNPTELHLNIKILPPWYRSWWAYILYFLLVTAAFLLYQRFRTKQAKLAYEVRLANLNAAKEKAEREMEKVVNEREKETNEKRLAFFTDVSHEFRTPLTLVINPLKNILYTSADKDNATYKELGIVYRNARRLLSLVDQLLLFRKTDTGADQLKITARDFVDICKEVYQAFIQEARSLNINYIFNSPNHAVEIYADREKIEIILYNLISNALKYTPAGGTIVVGIQENEEKIELTVTDNGYGIPKDVGDKLFERFYQVKHAETPAKSGFGIGLYLTKQFVEAHKANILYNSKPGEGTTFTVLFKKGKEHFDLNQVVTDMPADTNLLHELPEQPLVTNNTIVKNETGELEPLITQKPILLVVDDDEQMRNYLQLMFTDKYTVYQAASGDDGMKMSHQYQPNIIITDVKMPGISGIEFCKNLKKDTGLSHIPVILLTGEASLQKKLEGAEGGADDYITKPFENELLAAKVDNLLKSRSNLQNYFYNEITLKKNTLKVPEEYKEFLENCIAIVEKHMQNDQFSIKTLAGEIGMSHSKIYRIVKSISGQSVNAFVRFIRLRKAAELMISSNMNVNEACFEVGISDVKYFRTQFNKLFGMNPSEYIKKYRTAFGSGFRISHNMLKKDNPDI